MVIGTELWRRIKISGSFRLFWCAFFIFTKERKKVYKIDYKPSNSNIFYLETPASPALAVTEIGCNHQPAGFDSGDIRKDQFVLQYIVSGACTFNGEPAQAPAILFIKPGLPARYVVDADCSDFSTYWIKFGGNYAADLVERSGLNEQNEIFTPSNAQKIEELFTELISAERYADLDDSIYALGALHMIIALTGASCQTVKEKKISPYTQIILDYIHANYGKSISEKTLADIVNLSTNYMHRVFLNDMQTTPINYLNYYRIKCAKKILRDTNCSISKVADQVGISGGDYFCRVFRKYNKGMSPTEYKKAIKNRIIPKE